jgi:predicted phosphoribosyltransferase
MIFEDRADAGRQLAAVLASEPLLDAVVCALPRGGVPVGYEIAVRLGVPLDVLVARKIGAPGHRELGIGAIAEGGVVRFDQRAVRLLGISADERERLIARERVELDRRVQLYRDGREPSAVAARDVIVVDDGLATGVTARAAIESLAARRPRRILLAVPVGASDTASLIEADGVDLVCLSRRDDFIAVGHGYVDFDQTTDEQVLRLLDQAARP